MRRAASVLLLPLLSVGLAVPARAGVDRFTPLSSPRRGFVSPVVVDPERPSTLYAVGTIMGTLWKSYDAGATWTLLRDGLYPDRLGGGILRGPVFDPADSRRLWVWSAHAVWNSADGGGHWEIRQLGAQLQARIEDVLPDPEVPERLLALGEDTYVGGETLVLVTEDGGATWTEVARLAEHAPGSRLLAHPTSPRAFYVSAYGGLYRSEDGGETWTLLSSFQSYGFQDLMIAPSAPETLYAVPRTAPEELLRSEDGGLTWAPTALPEPRSYTWGVLVDPEDALSVRAVVQDDQAFFLLGSHDGGRTWPDEPVAVPPGYRGSNVFAPTLVADPRHGSVLYATPNLHKSMNGGRTWRRLGRDIQAGTVVSVAASLPCGRTVLLASAYDGLDYLLARSGDSGRTWRELPSSPELLVVASDRHRASRFWGLGLGVFRSDDLGTSWRKVSPDGLYDPTDILVDPVRAGRVFVGTMFGGVWRTEDAGETWVQSTRGLPVQDDCSHLVCPFVGPFAVDAGRDDRIYVVVGNNMGVGGALYRSFDGGARWSRVGASLPSVTAVAAHPERPRVLWVGTVDGVHASEDGGESWSRVPGLSAEVWQLLFEKSTGQLYAVARQGLFRSPRWGYSFWETLDAGLPEIPDSSRRRRGLIVDPSASGRVYYAADGLGIWTGRFVGAEPLALPTGRFELRAAFSDGRTARPGIPRRVSPERGLFALVFDGPPRLRVRLTPEGAYYRLSARAATEWEVELTVVDRLSGTARTYRLPRTKPRVLVDERAFAVAPFGGGALRGR